MISIVVPCFNHASALPELLRSIARQTIHDIEVIIIDDGSNDNPCKIVTSLSVDLPYPVQCLTTINQGAPAARNYGASLSKGEYILFADADLIMKPRMLEKLQEALDKNPNSSYAYSAFKFGWKKFSAIGFDAVALRKMNYIHTSALIRRVDFEGFDERLTRFQDWDLWLTLLSKGKVGVAVSDSLFTARVMRAGISKWRPSIWYKIWPIFGFTPASVRSYNDAKKIIQQKHGL